MYADIIVGRIRRGFTTVAAESAVPRGTLIGGGDDFGKVSVSFPLLILLVSGDAMTCERAVVMDMLGGSLSLARGTPSSLGSKVMIVQ